MTEVQRRWRRIVACGRSAWRGCGKVPYSSKRLARAKAEGVERQIAEPMNSYRCRVCRRWHIGHVRRRAA